MFLGTIYVFVQLVLLCGEDPSYHMVECKHQWWTKYSDLFTFK